MLSAETLRRSTTMLGGVFVALTLAGPASGQSLLGGVGSTVAATAESVEPATGAVADTTSKAAEPVTTTVVKVTQPVQSAAASTVGTAAGTAKAVAKTAASGTAAAQPVVRAATSTDGKVATAASRTTRSVEPLASAAVGAATQALESGTTALPSEIRALLGPLVETVDGQAEELVRSIVGAAGPAASTTPGRTTLGRTAARHGPARPGDATSGEAWPSPGAPLGGPISAWSGTTPPTPTGGAVDPGMQPAAPQRGAPAAPPFSVGSSAAGFSAALAVLAGLLALALAARFGWLLPWSDTIRPLALVSPPERPG